MTREFFIHYVTFPAPFFGEQGQVYQEADTAQEALEIAAEGMYRAEAYENADALHKKQEPLARYMSNRALAESKATTLMFMGWDGDACVLELDGVVTRVENARQGVLYEEETK